MSEQTHSKPIFLASIFQPRPTQWGLRGDPYLWDEMACQLADTPLPDSEATLDALLSDCFQQLTGHPLEHVAPGILVSRHRHGGLSSGHVSPDYWRNSLIPLLRARYRAWQPRQAP